MQSGLGDSCYEIIKLFGLGQCFLAAQEGGVVILYRGELGFSHTPVKF